MIKNVVKLSTMAPKQIESKGTDVELEIEKDAQELGVPPQLVKDPQFLGRMKDELDRLIRAEEQSQKDLAKEMEDWRKREAEKATMKKLPRPTAGTKPDVAEGRLRTSVNQKIAQLFPGKYEVVQGAYGVEELKLRAGQQPLTLVNDPEKMRVLGWIYYPEQSRASRQGNEPTDEEKAIVLQEVQGQGTARTPVQKDPLGILQ